MTPAAAPGLTARSGSRAPGCRRLPASPPRAPRAARAPQTLTQQLSKRRFLPTLGGAGRSPRRVAGVLRPAGRRVMLCLVLMAVELVIVSSRVQSANYTAYKPSTGRPRAQLPGRAAAPTPWPRAGSGPRFPLRRRPTVPGRQDPGAGARPPRGPSPGPCPAPRAHLAWQGQRAALRGDLHLRAASPASRASPRWLHPGRCQGPAPVRRASRGPSPQVPLPGPSLHAFSGRLPPPSLPGPVRPRKRLFRPQTLEPALSVNPVRPAAPSGRVTVAVAGQPPLEPRGGGGGARALWGGVGEGQKRREGAEGGSLQGKRPWRPRHRFLRSFSS